MNKMKFILLSLFSINLFSCSLKAVEPTVPDFYSRVDMRAEGLPLSVIRVSYNVGSSRDDGKPGMTYLTAELMRQSGLEEYFGQQALSRDELESKLKPLGAVIGVQVARAQTTFSLTVPSANIKEAAMLFSRMLVSPGLDKVELARIKKETLQYLEDKAPKVSQEELGKTALLSAIYGNQHEYAHAIAGRVSSVKDITQEDVLRHMDRYFYMGTATLGLAGSIPDDVKKSLINIFSAYSGPTLPPNYPKKAEPAKRLTIVTGDFPATGVHLGHSLHVNRSKEAFAPLYLGVTAFGKHRSFVGRLMNVVREVRGLNYGTYAYIEEFPNGGSYLTPPVQVARLVQEFSMWGRPTPHHNGCFLTRQMTREAYSLAEKGITEKEFDLVRSHLVGQIPLLAESLHHQLGYAMDDAFYLVNGHLKKLQAKMKTITRDEVNAALKQYIKPDDLRLVVVTKDADQFKKDILSPFCKITYSEGVEHEQSIYDEDKLIGEFQIPGLNEDAINVRTAESYFE